MPPPPGKSPPAGQCKNYTAEHIIPICYIQAGCFHLPVRHLPPSAPATDAATQQQFDGEADCDDEKGITSEYCSISVDCCIVREVAALYPKQKLRCHERTNFRASRSVSPSLRQVRVRVRGSSRVESSQSSQSVDRNAAY